MVKVSSRPRAAIVAGILVLTLTAPTEASVWHVTKMTWYGPGFYGSHTACGQLMTRKLIGVANRTLPCGTRIEIRYHGHDRIVKVVDRGPYGVWWTLDATARLAIHLTGHPPHTMYGVKYGVLR